MLIAANKLLSHIIISNCCFGADGQNDRCPNPGVPVHGRLLSDSNFSIGGIVQFKCDPGYLMIGDKQQTCMLALQWTDGGAPLCVGKLLNKANRESCRCHRTTLS